MSNKRTDPYKTDEFWISLMDNNLAKPAISESFRKRCERIKRESERNLQKISQAPSLHYPMERK